MSAVLIAATIEITTFSTLTHCGLV